MLGFPLSGSIAKSYHFAKDMYDLRRKCIIDRR